MILTHKLNLTILAKWPGKNKGNAWSLQQADNVHTLHSSPLMAEVHLEQICYDCISSLTCRICSTLRDNPTCMCSGGLLRACLDQWYKRLDTWCGRFCWLLLTWLAVHAQLWSQLAIHFQSESSSSGFRSLLFAGTWGCSTSCTVQLIHTWATLIDQLAGHFHRPFQFN